MLTEGTHMGSDAPPDVHLSSIDVEDEEISLGRVFTILWSYRRVIELGVAAVMTAFVLVVLAARAVLPADRFGSVGFRLSFEGVDRGIYPNGVKFSTDEIISPAVLSEVFAKNNLERYVGSFQEFKNSVFLRAANRDLELLDFEYQARLADARLGNVDRARLEAEYREKRTSLTAPIYAVTYHRNERVLTIPNSTLDKVLTDILATWAQQADERKGALRYDIPIFSRNMLPESLVETEDYLVAVDILRAKAVDALETVDRIGKLPGAFALRAGPEHTSLAEIRATLNDILRFKLQPLISTIRQSGVSKDPRALRSYLQSQLLHVKFQRDEETKRIQTMQDSLRVYSAEKGTIAAQGQGGATGRATTTDTPVLPQLSDSFLDRIVSLSTQSSDNKYRQELTDKIILAGPRAAALDSESQYYQELLSTPFPAAAGGQAAATTTATLAARDGIAKSLDQINAFYKELSALNLNPGTMLYTIVESFSTRTERSLSLSTVVLYGALTFLFALFLIPVGCLIHNSVHGGRPARI